MSSDEPGLVFGNQPEAQPNGAAQQDDQQPAESSQLLPPRLKIETTLSAEAENRIVERLLNSLQTLGIPQQCSATSAASVSQPEAHSRPIWNYQEAEYDPWADWQDLQPQEGWNQSYWNWEQTSWNLEAKDRPRLSNLNFPTFNGNKEDFANYKQLVTNLKAQCSQRDHKYLAPQLISKLKGALSDTVRSMELNAAEYYAPDGVERLLDFIQKRLDIRELDLETEDFKKQFDDIVRKRGETLIKYIHAEE